MNLPGKLEKVGIALGLTVLKDKAGHALMLKMTKPRKPRKAEIKEFEKRGLPVPTLWRESEEDFARLIDYCEQDVRAEGAVHDFVPRLNGRELSVFHFDQIVNARGVQVDVELARSATHLWSVHAERVNSEVREATGGKVASSDAVQQITKYANERGVTMSDCTADTVTHMLKHVEMPDDVWRVLRARQELAMASIAKYPKFVMCTEDDGRIRGAFQYNGAGQTGRWAGRLVQPHNLPRGEWKFPKKTKAACIETMVEAVKTRDLDFVNMVSPLPLGKTLSSLLRSVFIAAPGKKLIVTDFAAVEARGLAWASGEEWLLKAFQNKEDVYKGMASQIYNVDKNAVTDDQRQVGKVAILGCGYQMSGGKFWATLESYGIEATPEFAVEVVAAYRASNKRIKSFWYDVQGAAIKAVKAGGRHRAGPFVFFCEGGWLKCRLPAGRTICYYKPEIRAGSYGDALYFKAEEKNQWRTCSTYGGKLVENLIQALCRDILVDAMGRLEKNGYTIVGHVHDEAFAEVDMNFGSPHEMEEIMCEVPAWAKGFPVGAEGWEATRYRK